MLHNHNIYAETLVQTLASFMVTASVSVSPCELCLVNSVLPCSPGILHPLWFLESSVTLPDLKEKRLIETSDLVSPNNIWPWVSAPVRICWWRKFLWWQLEKSLIYKYIRISLGINSLYFLPILFDSTQSLWEIQSLVPSHLWSIRYCWPPTQVLDYYPSTTFRQDRLSVKDFMAGLVYRFLFL